MALLGETPDQHQSQVLALAKGTYNRSHSTSKVPNVHELNRKIESKLTFTEPSREIAARLESAKTFEEEWVPDAYVLFVRIWKCSCGNSGSCLDISCLFLRHRKRAFVSTKTGERNDEVQGHPRIYQPARSLVYPKLPRLKEVSWKSLTLCEACFEGKEVECEPNSAQASTVSSGSEELTPSTLSTHANLTSLPELLASSSLTKPAESDGSSSHSISTLGQTGSDYERLRWEDDGGLAIVQDLSSHTNMEGVVYES